ncbi:hypothetical protein MVEN_00078600 [Mycena venus]|uniref:Uncharacterized protein n=1 Tax=Mycena venus TaxID=2733690 RepID=A0A8H7DH98_9AGAR|nr:hypothetical protein MVEN_00078600 [Mycena venus]
MSLVNTYCRPDAKLSTDMAGRGFIYQSKLNNILEKRVNTTVADDSTKGDDEVKGFWEAVDTSLGELRNITNHNEEGLSRVMAPPF